MYMYSLVPVLISSAAVNISINVYTLNAIMLILINVIKWLNYAH